MAECLTCEELEQKICDLADEIASAECNSLVVKESGTTFDYSAGIKAKQDVLKVYQEMFRMKCSGASPLYEFVHVPCVKPAVCVGTTCRTGLRSSRTGRRYRR